MLAARRRGALLIDGAERLSGPVTDAMQDVANDIDAGIDLGAAFGLLCARAQPIPVVLRSSPLRAALVEVDAWGAAFGVEPPP